MIYIAMNNKDYLGKLFRTFDDFVSLVASRELEYIIFDAKYTTYFNNKMRKVLNEINRSKRDLELFVMFNTRGEIAIIDSKIVGKYIANYYNIQMEKYYKDIKLNKIVWDVINGKSKTKRDFMVISYKIIYKVLNEIYMDIKCNKSILNEYKFRYGLENYSRKNISTIVISILILEDICNYIGIEEDILLDYLRKIYDDNI